MILETSQRQLSELVIHQLNALFTPRIGRRVANHFEGH